MFCVECGKEEPIFRDGVCLSCYLKTHTFTKGPDFIDLPVCPHCNSYKYKNTWTTELFGDVIKRVIKNTFQISRELQKMDINTDCKESKDGMSCKVLISGYLGDIEISEEHELLVRLKTTVCDICSKRFGGYHEAIVQIRSGNRNLAKNKLKEIITAVEFLVEDLRAKGNRAIFITDIGEERGGVDFYISERGAGLVIAKTIKDRYGGEIKQSSKNIGMKDGKQLYRMTYLVRLPSYTKGDFLQFDDSFFYVISIHGNKVKMINLADWNESAEDLKTIQKSIILGRQELISEMILVSQNDDEIQLMDSKTYKISIIKKPKPMNLKVKNVKILKTEKQIFLVPNKNI